MNGECGHNSWTYKPYKPCQSCGMKPGDREVFVPFRSPREMCTHVGTGRSYFESGCDGSGFDVCTRCGLGV